MNDEFILAIAFVYLLLNIISFTLFGADKRRAIKDRYRISEATLIVSGLFGPFGALAGMKLFRHKTRKPLFKVIYVFAAVHIVLIIFLIWEFCPF